jgi:FkbH-like protein
MAQHDAAKLREQRVLVLDYDALVRDHGYARWHDARLWHLGRARLARSALAVLASAYARYLAALQLPRRKCLVLDLDNTLWGGVLGEDGLGGIQLGHSGLGLAYREFQMAILALYHRGIILAIASKNNEADALEALRNHPDMVLRPEHFAAHEIHWTEKSESIKRIADKLNIGIDSLVFWDDSPMERGMVASQLPDVLVAAVPDDASDYARCLRELACFDALSLTSEDQNRGRMYREQVERDSFLEKAETGAPESPQSLDAYYASLEMTIQIDAATDVAIPRIAQLTQRTNQFNLSTRRYTEAEIRTRVADPAWRVYGLSLRDRFGDLGLVGAALMREDAHAWDLDTLLMSCRALGRRVEEAFAAHLLGVAASTGKPLGGVFIPTKKNAPIREMLERHGWIREQLSEPEPQYRIEVTSITSPTWLRIVRS